MTELYKRYKGWSDSRGERPLSQIGFHRKLSDRGIEVLGAGNRAILSGISLAPHEVPTHSSPDFASAARFAQVNF